jgi:hypothetical protein
MFLTANDSRRLVLAVMALDATYYNWQTAKWEKPFDPVKHTVPFQVIDPTPPMHTVQDVDVSDMLLTNRNIIPVVLAVDPKSGKLTVTDVWPLPNPLPQPVPGGYAYT